MRSVIVGAGRVGLRTARALEEGDHDVVLVESDERAIDRARAEGFTVIEGDGALEPTLQEAGIDDADAIGALTSDLNDNFASCMIADQHDCRTVMRIDEDYREDIYRRYADEVDEVVYPERLGAVAAKNALVGGNSRAIADIEQNLQLVEFVVTDEAPVRGSTLTELELPSRTRLLAFGTGGEPLRLPTPDDTLGAGDRLVVLSDSSQLDDVRRIVVGEPGKTALGGV